MIEGLKAYEGYRDSGLLTVGRVPSHWRVLRAKALFEEVDDRSTTGREELLSVSHISGVRRRSELNATMFLAKSNKGHKRCHPNDLVINTMWAWMGALAISPYDGLVSPSYGVYRPRSDVPVLPRYAHHLLRAPAYVAEYSMRSTGIHSSRSRLYPEQFLRIPLVLPPLEEQEKIVLFLDHANARIERYIRAKRRVIALLNEEKQAIIRRCVTRGLDPTVPLKPSGIPWLGDIPQHWEISRVKNEFQCLNTRRIPLNSVERGEMTTRLYDYYGASGVIDKVDDYLFDDELLLIAEDGANLLLRNLPLAIVARGRFWVNNHAHILKPKRGDITYLAHVLETLNYAPWISGAAQPKLTQDRLLSIAVAVAPVDEQAAIVRHVSERTQPLSIAVSRVEREIGLLREYRTRLVLDVVTGKLDVRAVAQCLPVESAAGTTDVAVVNDEAEAAEEAAV